MNSSLRLARRPAHRVACSVRPCCWPAAACWTSRRVRPCSTSAPAPRRWHRAGKRRGAAAGRTGRRRGAQCASTAPPCCTGSAYADAQQLQPYAQARWSMPPAQLLRQRLRQALAQQSTVMREGEVATAASAGAATGARRVQPAVRCTGQKRRAGARPCHGDAGRPAPASGWWRSATSSPQRPAPSADAAGGVRA